MGMDGASEKAEKRRIGTISTEIRTGRPLTYDPSWMDEVARETLSKGYPDSSVAVRLGVSSNTIYRWLREGLEQGEGSPFWSFVTAVESGRGAFEEETLDVIRRGLGGWQASAWLLERTRPTRYARTDRADPEGKRDDFKLTVTVEYVQTTLPAHNAEARLLPEPLSEGEDSPADDTMPASVERRHVPSSKHGTPPSATSPVSATRVTAEVEYAHRTSEPVNQPDDKANRQSTDQIVSSPDNTVEAEISTMPLSVGGAIEGTYRELAPKHVRFPSSRVNKPS